MKTTNRKGSVLMLALWIIAVLSVMVVSFAYEAHQQAGLDVYVRERNRVRRTVDSGRMLAEAVLLDFQNAKDPEINSGIPDWEEIFEDDRWCVEKYNLKNYKECQIGPLVLDDREEVEDESELVTLQIDIRQENAKPKIDINSLVPDTDNQYILRWQNILQKSGITDELEVEVEEADRSGHKKHNLQNLLIASWKDWTDSDDTVSSGPITDDESDPQEDDGAEKDWYEERQEEDEIPIADRRYPPNGKIKKLEELSFIRGFRDFPAVLTGGLLYPKEKESEENPRLGGIMQYFKISGGSKITINDRTTSDDLSTIPGLFPEDCEDNFECEDCQELIAAILGALRTMPEDDDNIDETRTWWPFKDINDLRTRVDDYGCDVQIPDGISEYIDFDKAGTSSTTTKKSTKQQTSSTKGGNKSSEEEVVKFEVTITGRSLGMKYSVVAVCYIDGSEVRYTEWREDPSTIE